MAEYIKRSAAIEAAKHAWAKGLEPSQYIEIIPAADVAPVVHGHWVVRFDGPYKRRRCYCSHCGKHSEVGGIAKSQEKPYCPNFGARMDGDSDALD